MSEKPGFDLTKSRNWSALEEEAENIASISIASMFSKDMGRVFKYQLRHGGILLDCSKNLVTDNILENLLGLAEESPLATTIEDLFQGKPLNNTENRPALHTTLRASPDQIKEDGLADLAANIQGQQQRMAEISDQVRSGSWIGSTGKAITDVVNLGIGGSDLGPRLVCEALKEYAHPGIQSHFVSNVDGEVIHSLLKTLNPETTLVIIASKTFTTQETLLNAHTVAHWLKESLGLAAPFTSTHFIGVTASTENAQALGLPQQQILEFWDWVGGRYSVWSAIGLPIAISTGAENFDKFLAGARGMDSHFRNAPWAENLPVVLALLGIWYSNFLNAETCAVVPYCERLLQLPFYLQQLDMESNGKCVTKEGEPTPYSTGPILWGQTGTNGQHSFFQLLHQGKHLVPVDFIGVVNDPLSAPEHHKVLLANMLAQSSALMVGRQDSALPAWRHYSGNRPSNVILLEALTPEILGALIALYEHKVFVQGCLWNINSFDQWGVELGKSLTGQLLQDSDNNPALDPSTRELLKLIPLFQQDSH